MKEKEFSQMTYNDRLRLDTLIRAGHKPKEVAVILHKHISTIYRELKRGRYMHTNKVFAGRGTGKGAAAAGKLFYNDMHNYFLFIHR